MARRPRARRDLRARLRRRGQGLLGVDAGQARDRRAVDGGRARDRRARGHGAPLRAARARPAGRVLGVPTPPLAEPLADAGRAGGARPRHRERGARLRLLPRQGQAQDARPGGRGARRRGRARAPAHARAGRQLARARRGRRARDRGDVEPTGAFLLSPFDNLLWDRFEAEHLFGFEHRLEIYKPSPRASTATTCCRCSTARRSSAGSISRPTARPVRCGRWRCTGRSGRDRAPCARRSRGSLMCSGSRGARSRVEFETRAIHAGQEPDPLTGAVNVPIYQTSTYAQDGVLQMRGGHDYARTINPTRTALETCLAALEGGAHGICFSSGMGATTAVIELFEPGCDGRDQRRLRRHLPPLLEVLAPKGYRFAFVDLTDEGVVRERVRAAGRSRLARDAVEPAAEDRRHRRRRRARARGRRPGRRRQHVREPVPAAAARARRRLRRALDHEVHRRPLRRRRRRRVTNDAELAERLHFVQNSIGAVPGRSTASSPCAAPRRWRVRMERHCDNAAASRAGSPSRPPSARSSTPASSRTPATRSPKRQMRRFGGMISFRVHGGRAAVDAALAEHRACGRSARASAASRA